MIIKYKKRNLTLYDLIKKTNWRKGEDKQYKLRNGVSINIYGPWGYPNEVWISGVDTKSHRYICEIAPNNRINFSKIPPVFKQIEIV